ncbi:hypothetical protein L7F22_045401 [Adiantum nelumboides]|nr:hypothetical protein [Adiantum nelumboides]
MFWSKYRPKLAQVACRRYPWRGIQRGMITEEIDIRSCFFSCIAESVSDFAFKGLQENLILASAASMGASNADVGGFITRPKDVVQEEYMHSSDGSSTDGDKACEYDFDLDEEVIPIEVKPEWQLHLKRTRNVVQMMHFDDEKVEVRRVLAQIFLYMLLEESMYGILTTKDRSVFLRYTVQNDSKQLEASRTVCYDDPIGVRKCFLFMLMTAKDAERCPLSQIWTTLEEEKWVPPSRNKGQSLLSRDKMKKVARTQKAARTSAQGRRRGGRQASRGEWEMEIEGASSKGEGEGSE